MSKKKRGPKRYRPSGPRVHYPVTLPTSPPAVSFTCLPVPFRTVERWFVFLCFIHVTVAGTFDLQRRRGRPVVPLAWCATLFTLRLLPDGAGGPALTGANRSRRNGTSAAAVARCDLRSRPIITVNIFRFIRNIVRCRCRCVCVCVCDVLVY